MQYIKIHSQDNVAVALADMTSGSVVTIDNDTVTLSQDACVTNYGSCRPWAVLTASPGRSRIVS